VGDCTRTANACPSPTGWAPTKSIDHRRWAFCLCGSPPRGRLQPYRLGKPSPTGWAPTKATAHCRWVFSLCRSPPRGRLQPYRLGKPSPTGWAPTKSIDLCRWAFCLFVGAHPVGDCTRTANACPSPTGWAPTKSIDHRRWAFCLCGSPPRGRLQPYRQCMPIAHRVGSCKRQSLSPVETALACLLRLVRTGFFKRRRVGVSDQSTARFRAFRPARCPC